MIKYKCLSCNKDYSNELDEELNKKIKNTFKFSNNDINNFNFFLRKSVYPYEYMNDWEKLNKTTLPDKEKFYSNLNIEDITDVDYMHGKKIFSRFWNEKRSKYHDLYLKSDTLLLADVFQNLREMCLKIYQLDPSKFNSAPRLAW